ncbi:MAG: phosphoribosylformylglycinamidine synthase [Dokdonella sp.]
MICLDGQAALSAFRIDRLNAALVSARSDCRVLAAYTVYFVIDDGLSVDQRQRVAEVLQATGPASEDANCWVVPRLGTISPWSSKATDILRDCGLNVQRVEHGIAFRLLDAPAAESDDWDAVIARLHDSMTQSVLTDLASVGANFAACAPAPLVVIALGANPVVALRKANQRLGLALAEDEIEYLASHYARMGHDPSDAELMMFAQANSEHCRHKVFNASFSIDGKSLDKSLFAMIRNTHAKSPAHTLSAYSDNAAVIAGSEGQRFWADPQTGVYRSHSEQIHYAIKVETHNHPTAISPFPGAATGSGGEIRDEGATGRGGKPKAGLTGFSVSHLRIPELPMPWESKRPLPPRFATAFEIMRDGPLGAAAFNNEFGRPCLGGYFRSFEQETSVSGKRWGYDKPIMIAGGIANLRGDDVQKNQLRDGDVIIVLGGPAMLIGLGGSAASSMTGGSSSSDLDYASVQRDNPEMQRRCQEVIDACWARADANPIVSIHDVGAGGLSNAIPELLNDSKVGGIIDLRAIPCADPQLSPMQIWCNESQERYVLGLRPNDVPLLEAMCARERCVYAVVGQATERRHLLVKDCLLDNAVVDLALDVLFGKPPRMHRDARRVAPRIDLVPDVDGITLDDALRRVLTHPSVGSKSFLVTIGDRSVGGLCARDPMVGPWQVPVADCAVTLCDFEGHAGEAMAMGERTPLAVLDARAAARMAVGEALTNLVSAGVVLDEVRLSANWMAAVNQTGEDAALYDAVQAIGMELCPALGISIPVGKDSMSMQTQWSVGDANQVTVSPVSPIITAFARVDDVRGALTPQLQLDQGKTELWLIDLGGNSHRLGGSILMECCDRAGGVPPDLDSAERIKALFALVAQARKDGLLLACHDRSDGGAIVALIEMAFAGHCGLDLNLDSWAESWLRGLFSEELGLIVQVRERDHDAFATLLETNGLAQISHVVGRPMEKMQVRLRLAGAKFGKWNWSELMTLWSQTSHAMQRLRDNPASADAELSWRCDADDIGLRPKLGFAANDDIAAPYISRGVKPRIAVLREQGVNGQIEMAAAFTRAGFEAVDVHMSDLAAGRHRLADFKGMAACGGFSYGDVLGAGRGWATSILFNDMLRDQFARHFGDPSKFALGVCNGCQMLAQLKDIIPGAAAWPKFVRNASEQYEARLTMVEVVESPSILFRGMAGSRIPVVVAHGEGRTAYPADGGPDQIEACLRFVDNAGKPTEQFPLNPNGSPQGITGITAADGRVTALMPHPERVFRSVQMSWRPADWGEASPWLRLFRNARVWVD